MDVFIVTLPEVDGSYEASAVVVAGSAEEAIELAIEDCSFVVMRCDVECEQVCDEEPCVHWLT